MLREYRLTNFKAFGDTVTIPIRPLTLIFGANSSGKSSIFQSLLLLKQTLKEAKNPETALLPNGSLVDLGMYRDFVYRHETERNFEVGARFTLDNSPTASWEQRIFKRLNLETVGLNIVFGYKTEAYAVTPSHLNIDAGEESRPSIFYSKFFGGSNIQVAIDPETEYWHHLLWETARRQLFSDQRQDHGRFHKFLPTSWQQNPHKNTLKEIVEDRMKGTTFTVPCNYKNFLLYFPSEFLLQPAHSSHFVEFKESIRGPAQSLAKSLKKRLPSTSARLNAERVTELLKIVLNGALSNTQQICSSFHSLWENFIHLGPLRDEPERYYSFSGDTTDYVGQSGESLPSILFEDQELIEQTNSDLERLGTKYKVKFDKLQYEDASRSNVFSLRLVHTDTAIDASLRDVGFGISQVLPIVVQSRLSEKKTLLIEQPEIHLHPAHQAELGDLFIRSAKERGNTLLLETHSEHLILRILRRIRETTENGLPEDFPAIRPEDVAVLYVQPSENGAQVVEIPITEDGEFAYPWPGGFFAERVKELF